MIGMLSLPHVLKISQLQIFFYFLAHLKDELLV